MPGIECEGGMNVKCVIVVDRDLPLGLKTNAAAALGMSLGAQVDGLIGPDVIDADGYTHRESRRSTCRSSWRRRRN